MTTRTAKIPGADHPITVARNPARVLVKLGDTILADSRDALTLREANYGGVQYIPRKDVDMSLLERSDHASYCPYKGEASYYSVKPGGAKTVNAVWTYERPYESVAGIGSYLAFYPDRFDIIEEPRNA